MAAVFIGGTIWLSISWNRSSVNALRTQDVVEYQMPRPQAYRKGFDMSGRQVQTKVISPEKRVASAAAIPAVPVPAAVAAKDKKANAKKAAKTAQNKNIRKNKLRVAMVDTDLNMGMSALEDKAGSKKQQNQYVAYQEKQPIQDTNTKEEKKLSAAQWREILNSKPSFSKASEFRAAMMAGHISAGAYYKIVEELLLNAADEKSAVAVFLLNQDGSIQAFEMLVKHQNDVRESQRAAVKAMIENFSQSTRFGTLARALSNSNADVAREATRLIGVALTALNEAPAAVDPRGSRGSANTVTPASFAIFVMPLTQAANNGSPIASEAADLLQRIQALI